MDALDKTSPSVGDTAEITELIQLRQKLEQAEEKIKGLEDELEFFKLGINSSKDDIGWIDVSDGRYVLVNESLCQKYGYTREEMMRISTSQLLPAATPKMWFAARDKIMQLKDGLFETTITTKDNRILPFEVQVSHFMFKGKMYGFGISRDILGRKRFQDINIAAQQEALLNNIPHIAWIKDGKLRYTAVNEAYARFCNRPRESIIGLTDFDLWPEEWAEKFHAEDQALVESGQPMHFEALMPNLQGKTFWGEVFKTPIAYDPVSRIVMGCVGIILDITDRKAAEATLQKAHADLAKQLREREMLESQLVQAQKMKAVGQLASGVAHDFNSLLTVIMGRLNLLESHITDDTGHHALCAANHAVERAAKLTKQLLAFARKQPLYPHAVDLNTLIQEMDLLLQNALGDKVRLEKVPAKDLWPALADVNQVQLAILNLVSNACEAMPNGGLLQIGAGNIRINSGSETPASDLEPGEYVRLFVSDTGTGMSEDVLNQAFEPFFTTKGVGRGTGLGLSQVYGLAKQLGGTAQLKSAPGEGTTVELFLPRALEAGDVERC